MPAQLWLLRHGEAEPHGTRPDPERALTARGERQSVAAGHALVRLGIELSACYTSPKVRARDTAKLACQSLGLGVEEVAAIAEGFDVEVVHELFARHDDEAKLLVVGHNPDFEQVVYDLTGARADFKKGAIVAVRIEGRRRGSLLAMLRPRELEALAADAVPAA